jgi:predicted house-cleaning noncanonical NTP pyrophosphatase (MazG superfamily)
MHQVVRIMLAAFVAVALVHTSGAATAQPVGMPPAIKQIKLTEKQIEGFIAAQKDVSPILEKVQGAASEQLPPKLQAELEAAVKKHGFKDFADYDEVVANITMVMAGIDPKTKAFTEPEISIKKEIADVTADKSIPDQAKKQMLEELNEALKSAEAIKFPSNIELVKKYYEKIDAALT